jgi:hypothetical protein
MEARTDAVDGDADEGGVETVLSRKSSKLEQEFRKKGRKRTREVDYDRVRHALWNQDQCDCGCDEWVIDRYKDGGINTGNAGDEITSEPSKIWDDEMSGAWKVTERGAGLYRVIQVRMGKRLLT